MADERSGLTSSGRAPPTTFSGRMRAQASDFMHFMYDADKKAVMGRTALSWGKIGLFYLIYYSCLAAFVAIWMQIFLLVVHDDYPRQMGMASLLKNNPGMGFRPMPDVEKTLIQFNTEKPKSYKKYVDNLEKFLAPYEESGQGESCEYTSDGVPRNNSKECRFDSSLLGDACSKNNSYGYPEGKPCVLLKMNKVYGFEPEPYTDAGDLPKDALKAGIESGPNWSPNSVGVTCEGEKSGDTENRGPVSFYPTEGFDVKFFPYLNQKGYLAPVVMVKFNNPKPGVLIMMWCKVWAKNIYHHKNDKAGGVMFELIMDTSDEKYKAYSSRTDVTNNVANYTR